MCSSSVGCCRSGWARRCTRRLCVGICHDFNSPASANHLLGVRAPNAQLIAYDAKVPEFQPVSIGEQCAFIRLESHVAMALVFGHARLPGVFVRTCLDHHGLLVRLNAFAGNLPLSLFGH